MDAVIGVEQWTALLGLEGLEVVEVERDEAARVWRFAVVPTEAVGLCPHCHRPTDRRHACYDRVVRDLPLGSWQTELVVRGFQFECAPCRKFFTPRVASLAPSAHATERFLARLADLAGRADVSAAARFFGVAERTAGDWYYAYVERKRREPASASASASASAAAPLKPLRSLGIDELSVKKGTASSAAC